MNNFNLDKDTLIAARNKDKSALLKNINAEDRKKIEEALADKEKLQQILNSDYARQLMKILGGKQNG